MIILNELIFHNGYITSLETDPESEEDRQGFDESTARITRIIQAEIDKGVPPEKIIVGGFSQGGALAFHDSLRFPHRYFQLHISI